jgi:hypothetical protein
MIRLLDAREGWRRLLEVSELGFRQQQAAGKTPRRVTGRGSAGRLEWIAAIVSGQ